MYRSTSKAGLTRQQLSITESPSNFEDLDKMTVNELLTNINQEDAKVHLAVREAIPQIETLIKQIHGRMQKGGRLFYLGAGTSGRLGVLDASEVPPSFGVPDTVVIGLIAGGETALRKAVESAEDDPSKAWSELEIFNINTKDSVIGIAASGTTPYVIGGIQRARENGILTGCITCNPDSPIVKAAEHPVVVVVGPEFVTGSTRLKAGTAQKMVLNMITTTLMIKLGRVKGNKMVNMQLTNKKLIERGTRMIVEELDIQREAARILLMEHGSVKKALEFYREHYE
ncbi:MAG: N-acetylmuramic acid 6-phosphate etherase [Bacteroidales bacterium]|jgi:N-acetylmuramic acid 6-phosphate etherase|nr:N-acetylmuramic acid 6-phosphate etherase [Bacteroidales bacterium]